MALLTRGAPTPVFSRASVDGHPLVVDAVRRRREVASRLDAEETEHARLVAEHTDYRKDAHERQVAEYVDRGTATTSHFERRLSELDAGVKASEARLGLMRAAAGRLGTLEGEARVQALTELREQVLTQVKSLLGKQAALYAQTESLTSELVRLCETGLISVSPIFFIYSQYFNNWRAEASRYGVDV